MGSLSRNEILYRIGLQDEGLHDILQENADDPHFPFNTIYHLVYESEESNIDAIAYALSVVDFRKYRKDKSYADPLRYDSRGAKKLESLSRDLQLRTHVNSFIISVYAASRLTRDIILSPDFGWFLRLGNSAKDNLVLVDYANIYKRITEYTGDCELIKSLKRDAVKGRPEGESIVDIAEFMSSEKMVSEDSIPTRFIFVTKAKLKTHHYTSNYYILYVPCEKYIGSPCDKKNLSNEADDITLIMLYDYCRTKWSNVFIMSADNYDFEAIAQDNPVALNRMMISPYDGSYIIVDNNLEEIDNGWTEIKVKEEKINVKEERLLDIIFEIDTATGPTGESKMYKYGVDDDSLRDILGSNYKPWKELSDNEKLDILKIVTETTTRTDVFAKPREKTGEGAKETDTKKDLDEFIEPPEGRDSIVPIDDDDWDRLRSQENSEGIVLRDYQEKAIDFMKNNHGLIVSFGVGAGKTITAVMTALLLLHFKIVKEVYVIAPKSLASNFGKELSYYLEPSEEEPEATPEETPEEEPEETPEEEPVATPEEEPEATPEEEPEATPEEEPEETPEPTVVKLDSSLAKKIKNYTHAKFIKDFENKYKRCDNTLLIIDEASEFRTKINTAKQEGKSSFTMINCCIRAKRVMCLAATPLYNEFGDITNLIAMVKGKPPRHVPPTYDSKIRYVSNAFTFHDLVEDSTPEEVIALGDAFPPERKEYEHDFIMDEQYYSEYLKIQRSEVKDDATPGATPDPFVFLTGLRQATNNIKPNPKIKWVLDRIKELKLKTILFSSFIESGVKLLEEGLNEASIPYVTITGNMTVTAREDSVARYNNDEVSVLIISKAGGLGLDLKRTREIIFIEGNWNPAQEEQVIGRAARLGSHVGLPPEERYVNIHHLYLVKPPKESLAAGDNYPSADDILRDIIIRKKRELNVYHYLLRSSDIDPIKSGKYRSMLEELI